MNIDQLKPTAHQDNMDIMLMMQMDKFPEFSVTRSDVSDRPSSDFSGASNPNCTNIATIPHFINNNPHASSPSVITFPTNTISFSSATTPFQEPSILPYTSNSKWTSTPGEPSSKMAAMREMIYRIAAMQPIHIDPESVKPPKRRNVKISKDPQSVAARHRRERISERIRILQRLVPGGTKMDTASMLDEAIHYVKFLKRQVQSLERAAANRPSNVTGLGFPVAMSSGSYFPMGKVYQPSQNVQHFHGDA